MIRILFSLIILVNFVGCTLFQQAFRVPTPRYPGSLDMIRFERTPERITEITKPETQLVTVRFVNASFREGMRQLTELTGHPISWAKSLDTETVDGIFIDRPLDEVLGLLARRLNVAVTQKDGMYFLGSAGQGDTVSAVIRVPPVERRELQAALGSIAGNNATLIGSFIWVSDTPENIRNLIDDLEIIRERSERSYLAEVFFIRVKEDDFLRLTADLRINSIDIFSSAFNINQLFSMFIDGDGRLGSTLVDTRPVLMLSEGRRSTFEVGNEITRERRAVSETGIISTIGYDRFQDGIQLSLLLHRVSDDHYSLDLELEVSSFDRMDSSSAIPARTTSVLRSPGMLIKDGGVIYAGSLKRQDAGRIFGILSIDQGRGSDLLTIWVRCREIR